MLVCAIMMFTSFSLMACGSGSGRKSGDDTGGGGNTGGDAIMRALAIDSYVQSLASNNDVVENWTSDYDYGRDIEVLAEAPSGGLNGGFNWTAPAGYSEQYEKVQLEMSQTDLALWGNDPVAWLGNLVKINPVSHQNVFGQIVGLPRAQQTISINLAGATGIGTDLSTTVNSTRSSVENGISELVDRTHVPGAQLPFVYSAHAFEVNSQQDVGLALSTNTRGGFGPFKASVVGSLNTKEGEKFTTVVITIKQVYYTLNVDYPVGRGASGFFTDDVTLQHMQTAFGVNEVPAYIDSVSYGRIATVTISSTHSYNQLMSKLQLNASVGQVFSSENTMDYFNNISDSYTDMSYFIYGGSIEDQQGAIGLSNFNDLLDALNAPYDPTKNVGMPISYTVAHLGDGTRARVGNADTYYTKKLVPIPVQSVSFEPSFREQMIDGVMIGESYIIGGVRNPVEAVLYPITFRFGNASAEVITSSDSEYLAILGNIATIRMGPDTGGQWRLTIHDRTSSIGEQIHLVVEAGGKIGEIRNIQAMIRSYDVTFYFNNPAPQPGMVHNTWSSELTGRIINVPTEVPHRDGYRWLGWFLDAEGTVPFFPQTIIQSTTTVYGMYEEIIPDMCVVTLKGFYWNGDSSSDRTIQTEQNTIIPAFQSPSRAGFTFDGWFRDEEFTQSFSVTSDTVGNAAELVLFSKWTELLPSSVNLQLTSGKTTDLLPRERLTLTAQMIGTPEALEGRHIIFDLGSEVDHDSVALVTTAPGVATITVRDDISTYTGGPITIRATASHSNVFAEITINISTGWTFVYNATNFNSIRDYLSANYILIDNINLNTFATWTPIGGTEGTEFTGTLEGNNKSVTGFIVSAPGTNFTAARHFGLFGVVGASGIVKNLTVEGALEGAAQQSGSAVYAGLIAGTNRGRIENCTTNGRVNVERREARAGGVVGRNAGAGVITGCRNRAQVRSRGYTGGIVGINRATITLSSNSGRIIFKSNTNAELSASSDRRYVGGIAGTNETDTIVATISRCYNLGQVESETRQVWMGGIVGGLQSGEVSDVYNVGLVFLSDGNRYTAMGGIAGILRNNSILRNAYNSGWIVRKSNTTHGHHGGILGDGDSTVQNITASNVSNTHYMLGRYERGGTVRDINGWYGTNDVNARFRSFARNNHGHINLGANWTTAGATADIPFRLVDNPHVA